MQRHPDRLRAVFPERDEDEQLPSVDEILQAGAAVGDPDVVVGHIHALRAAGADAVIIVPLGAEPSSMLARAVPVITSGMR
jgi:alkanesulfonate monooxygenase SsuD/methylene tetrahydromethanopterin reductase-like flavin-dependent oxidoreductase (luciferase family)